MASEEDIQRVVAAHRDKYGRLDVLVNNAGVGAGATFDEHVTKRIDLQLAVNLRSIVLFYRECADMLQGGGRASTATPSWSTSPRSPASPASRCCSVYSATKAGVIGYTQAMNKELNRRGIKSVALCPGFVETPMTEFIREQVKAEDMIRTEDVAEAVRFVLRDLAQLRDPGDRLPASGRSDL